MKLCWHSSRGYFGLDALIMWCGALAVVCSFVDHA